jgi:hypothetical protein
VTRDAQDWSKQVPHTIQRISELDNAKSTVDWTVYGTLWIVTLCRNGKELLCSIDAAAVLYNELYPTARHQSALGSLISAEYLLSDVLADIL